MIGCSRLGCPRLSRSRALTPNLLKVPLPGFSCLSLFTTLGSVRTVRDKVQPPPLSLAGLDSVVQQSPVPGGQDLRLGLPSRPARRSRPDSLANIDQMEDDDVVQDLEWTARAKELEGGSEEKAEKSEV